MTAKWEASMRQFIRKVAGKYHYHQASDRDLLHSFAKERDETAFAILVRRHNQMVLGVGQRVLRQYQDAEDVCQATFLLLAQKANSVPWRDSVANWLYSVAYNLALRARDSAKRRQVREGKIQSTPSPDAMTEITSRDFQTVLDEELIRLPEKFSAPIVLCCLEGKSRDEAAKYLGWPLALVKSRLEEGRELLRLRLTRRGVLISTALASVILTAGTAQAALSMTAIRATSQAALQVLARKSIAGIVSAKVVVLIQGSAQTVLLSKIKVATAAMLATALVTTAIVAMPQRAFVESDSASATPKSGAQQVSNSIRKQQSTTPQQTSGKKNQDKFNIEGKVLGVDGKPAVGAKFTLLSEVGSALEVGKTAKDGRFKFDVPAPEDRRWRYLIASLDGAGFDLVYLFDKAPTAPVELRLVKDSPIKGRVINTEGKPIAGATVRVMYFYPLSESFLDPIRASRQPFLVQSYGTAFPGVVTYVATQTDNEGRFVISGAGAERVFSLRISGQGMADVGILSVVNRAGFDAKAFNETLEKITPAVNQEYGSLQSRALQWMLHGPDLTVVAETERTIRGVVKDIDTGKPRANVKVGLSQINSGVQLDLRATTDAAGRYEIHGIRRAKTYLLKVEDDTVTGHLGCKVTVPDSAGYEPLVGDIQVKKGVIVTGRVIDAVTNKGLPGFINIDVLSDNPFFRKYPNIGSARGSAADDGTFRCVTIPGHVLLAGGVMPRRSPDDGQLQLVYKLPVADPMYPKYFGAEFEPDGGVKFFGPDGSVGIVDGNFCKVLDIRADAEIVTQDIILEPAAALTVWIQDNVGNPLEGAWVTGMEPRNWENPIQTQTNTCKAYYLEPGKPRLMVFWEPMKKLVGTLALKGDERVPTVVKLGPPGSVKGRLLDENGKPLIGVSVDIYYPQSTARKIHDHIHRSVFVQTNDDGVFQFDTIIPGPEFSFGFKQGGKTFETLLKMNDRSMQNGDRLDIGEVRLKLKAEEK